MVCSGPTTTADVFNGVADSHFDQVFPPSLQDVQELEECNRFVERMAHLSLLEEEEQKIRDNFGNICAKRWEFRRQLGLLGRPRLQKNTIIPKSHEIQQLSDTMDEIISRNRLSQKHDGFFSATRYNNSRKNKFKTAARNNRHGQNNRINQPKKFNQ